MHVSPTRANPSTTHHASVFFFQAEHGIRARTVTGVQTCALPIWRTLRRSLRPGKLPAVPGLAASVRFRPAGENIELGGEIGRASCRERVLVPVEDGAMLILQLRDTTKTHDL